MSLQFRDALDIVCYNRSDIARDLSVSVERVSYLKYDVPLHDETRVTRLKRILPILKERRYLLNEIIMQLESTL